MSYIHLSFALDVLGDRLLYLKKIASLLIPINDPQKQVGFSQLEKGKTASLLKLTHSLHVTSLVSSQFSLHLAVKVARTTHTSASNVVGSVMLKVIYAGIGFCVWT